MKGIKSFFNKKQKENWKDISPEFTPELQKEWEKRGFTAEQVGNWIKDGLKAKDYDFAYYLSQKNFSAFELSPTQLAKLRKKHDGIRNWKNIHRTFTEELQKQWEEQKFSYEDCKEWIDAGLQANDVHFCVWLRDIKKANALRVLNGEFGKIVNLRKEYKENLNKSNSKVQEWLDQNYPNYLVDYFRKDERDRWIKVVSSRQEITELDISNKNLEGSLDLSDFINLKKLDISNTDINEVDLDKLPRSLEEIKYSTEYRSNCQLTKIVPQLAEFEWKDIYTFPTHFTLKERRGWEKAGFNKEQTKQWIKLGSWPSDYDFISWLRDNKGVGSEWAKNNQKEFQNLQDRYRRYSLCDKCQQPNTNDFFCYPCSQQNFSQTTSGNKEIDAFIQHQQSVATEKGKAISWITYEQFTDIEYLAEGGFGKVYKAKWGQEWDMYSGTWKDRVVVLKILNNSQNITIKFLQEIANHKSVNSGYSSIMCHIVNCHGISQDSITKNYVMVMDYKKDGDLRQYLRNNYSKLSFSDKIEKLHSITSGLSTIHSKGLIHRDFHSGNVLNSGNWSYITDFGLTKLVSEDDENIVYGVLPYVAPEVLRGQPYTQASDIYSFGMIAYEILSGLPPHYDQDWDDEQFIWDIIEGKRPQFQIKIPQLLEDKIKQCWNSNPLQRPTAHELEEILRGWWIDIRDDKDTEFKRQYPEQLESISNDPPPPSVSGVVQHERDLKFIQQVQETEAFNQNLTTELRNPTYKLHKGAVMYSRLINTKQITQKLQEYFASGDLNLKLDGLSLAEVNIQANPQEENSTQSQVQVPPK